MITTPHPRPSSEVPPPSERSQPAAAPDAAVPLTERSDEELLLRVRDGEAAAYAEIYRRYEHEARRFACSLVPTHDVDDVVAESFAKMLRALHGRKGPVDHPARYLMVTVRTTAATMHVRRARGQSLSERLGTLDASEDELPLFSDDRLVVAFRSLSSRWRQVIWWSEIEGMSPGEIGARLDLSPGAAAALSYRARRALREAYDAASDLEPT
jgi:RNA polymerase sigma factor (sigma-70 family)